MQTEDNRQLSLFPSVAATASEQAQDGTWKKSIPAMVFLNHFFAVSYHIQQSAEAYSLHNLVHFINFRPSLNAPDVEQVKKHLLNCWSTEYALRATAELGNEQYLRNALHWTFPQAYYSIFAGIQAFLRTLGISGTHPELIRREVGRLVVRGFYPWPVSFYAAGHYGHFKIHRLPLSGFKPSLNLVTREQEAQGQIGQFLRTTRTIRAKAVRQLVQNDEELALRSPKTGEILQRFSDSHWQQLTWRFGYTTYFDLLGRLKISANHREIERFVNAEIDFRLFHESLLHIVSYLNFVHECYIAKALGLDAYRQLVSELPAHLREGFVKERLTAKITPVVLAVSPDSREESAVHMSA
jgi:hypothetical protein